MLTCVSHGTFLISCVTGFSSLWLFLDSSGYSGCSIHHERLLVIITVIHVYLYIHTQLLLTHFNLEYNNIFRR